MRNIVVACSYRVSCAEWESRGARVHPLYLIMEDNGGHASGSRHILGPRKLYVGVWLGECCRGYINTRAGADWFQ